MIYLASKSPRRRELLTQMGVDFEVLSIDIPEIVKENEGYREYSIRICNEKANFAWEYLIENALMLRPVLTADTEVVFDNKVLGKPNSYDEAFQMWRMLAGNKHLVITTVTLKYDEFQKSITNETFVYFDNVTDDEIHTYLKTGDYKDKSGSYGIRSYAGQYIKKIDGCFYSVMGLPLNAVRHLLQELVPPPQSLFKSIG